MFKMLKKMFNDFLEWGVKEHGYSLRGTRCDIGFLAPLAIMAASKIAGAVAKKKSGNARAKEQKRADEAQAQANFETQSTQFANREDDRLTRTQGIGQQLTGARALSPEVLAAALKRRADPTRKGAVMDTGKGSGWGLAGDLANTAGDFAGAYIKGAGMPGPNASSASSGLDPRFLSGAGGSQTPALPCPDGSMGC